MATTNKSGIQSSITAGIRTGNSDTTAADLRMILNEILDSYANVVDGGFVQQSELGYTGNLTLTDARSFAHKGYVDSAIASFTADNGITKQTGNNFQLGGTLLLDTYIDGDNNYGMAFTNNTFFGASALNQMLFQVGSGGYTVSYNMGGGNIVNNLTSPNATISEQYGTVSGLYSFDINNIGNGSSISTGYYTLGFYDGFSWSMNNKWQLTMSNVSGLLYDDLQNGRLFRIDQTTGVMELPRYTYAGSPSDRHLLTIDPSGTVFDAGAYVSPVGVYVPYTGATNNLDMSGRTITAQSITANGSAGSGYLRVMGQSAAPAVPATVGGNIWFNASGNICWNRKPSLGNDTFTRGFSGNITADRFYILPDMAGTVALTSQIPTVAGVYMPLAGGTFTGTVTLAGDAVSALQPVTYQQLVAAVAGLYDLRGGYDASTNLFPSTGGSGASGAVLKADVYIITVAGTLGGVAVVPGDEVIALIDTPGQTAANWSLLSHDIGYTPENITNKAVNFLTLNNTLYPTTQAVANYISSFNYVPYTGATTAVNIGANTLTSGLHTIQTGSITGSGIVIRDWITNNVQSAIYMGVVPSGTNYALRGDSVGNSFLNGAQSFIATGGVTRLIINNNFFSANNFMAATSGAVTTFTFKSPNNSSQTASTEIPSFIMDINTKTWLTGNINIQRENWWKAATYQAGGASVITDAYGNYFEAPIAGANMTFTRTWAAGFNGNVQAKDYFFSNGGSAICTYFKDTTDSSTVASSTTEGIIKSVLVPANTFAQGDCITISTINKKVGAAGAVTIKLKSNTTNALPGTTLGTYTSSAGTLYFPFDRTGIIKTSNNNTQFYNATNTTQVADRTLSGTVAVSNIVLNWTVDQYIIISMQNAAAADVSTVCYFSVTKN